MYLQVNEGMNKGTRRYTHISMFKESLRIQFQVAWKVCTSTPKFPETVNYITPSLSPVCVCVVTHMSWCTWRSEDGLSEE